MKKFFLTAAMMASSVVVAHAHEGHGASDATSVIHYATEPLHVYGILSLLAVAAASWAIIARVRKARRT